MYGWPGKHCLWGVDRDRNRRHRGIVLRVAACLAARLWQRAAPQITFSPWLVVGEVPRPARFPYSPVCGKSKRHEGRLY
jgi:hypothetical protein